MRLKDFLREMDPMADIDQGDEGIEQDHTSPGGTYDTHKSDAAELLEEIENLLGLHSETQSGSADKWSHASEMAKVVAKLREVVDMLSPEGEGGEEDLAKPVSEGKNHMGESTIASYKNWRASCKKKNPDVWFDGDQDISQALVGPRPYKRGETKSIGEWDGETGTVYK
jgi:hypothetical protein